MKIPTIYRTSSGQIPATDREIAASYLKHTLIGDPLADRAVSALARLPSSAANQLLSTAINDGPDAMPNAPAELNDLFQSFPSHRPPPFDPSDARAPTAPSIPKATFSSPRSFPPPCVTPPL